MIPGVAWSQAPDLDAAERQVVHLTNELRQAQGLAALEVDAQLAQAAQRFAEFMARTGKYGHRADGRTPVQRAARQGYEHCIVAENIAYQTSSTGFDTEALAEGFVEGWKRSPGHRKNMLRPGVTETGVAIARRDEGGRHFAVQMFGRPASLSVDFEIANRTGSSVKYEMDGRTYSLPPRVTRTHKRCSPGTLEFRWPGGRKTVRAQDGDRLAVRRDASGELAVDRTDQATRKATPR